MRSPGIPALTASLPLLSRRQHRLPREALSNSSSASSPALATTDTSRLSAEPSAKGTAGCSPGGGGSATTALLAEPQPSFHTAQCHWEHRGGDPMGAQTQSKTPQSRRQEPPGCTDIHCTLIFSLPPPQPNQRSPEELFFSPGRRRKANYCSVILLSEPTLSPAVLESRLLWQNRLYNLLAPLGHDACWMNQL